MSKNNILLRDLIDPAIPEMTPFFPQTIGWKIAGVFILLSSLLVLLRWWKSYQANRYRRIALKAIARLPKNQPNYYLTVLNSVLKQTACHCYPHSSVASLYGEAWLLFLQSKSNSNMFSSSIAQQWQQAIYAKKLNQEWTPSQLRQLELMACDWIKQHR
ncbi:DUF4381 domain-containing protein [Vibrio mediterranei]|uniref:DUF4381 domain-containing protein n=1 Tax=Vibrio mediterranei TaxID=689 RepID=A0AAN1FLH1_9VIBR|nr:DUF4381 domain-containing protein [Vibrio mediterranei]ASI92764.1 hypothetical protein BSZ05_23650 [Vibrio mediterranei]